jgi:DNA-binding GntR family transcriptional regulator
MTMAVDPRNPLAIYRQIAADIAERIDAGEFADTMLIPSEAEICEAYDVSRKTARAAVALLAEEGRVVPVQGKGVFVKADTQPPADSGEQAGG